MLQSNYGLTIEILSAVFKGEAAISSWSLHGIPKTEFYRKLHCFLKKWPVSRCLTKTFIGGFYLAIDNQLQERGSTPFNTYKFIERVVSSDTPDSSVMSYGYDKRPVSLQIEIQDLDAKMKEQQIEITQLKSDFKQIKEDLLIRDITQEVM